jgi:hypothetical protein
MEVSGQLHHKRKITRYPLRLRVGGPQSRTGRGGEGKIPTSAGIETRKIMVKVTESERFNG